MKKAIKDKYTYINAILPIIGGVGLPFIIYGICCACGYNKFPYYYIFAFDVFACFLIGMIVADVKELHYRKEHQLLGENELPIEEKDKLNKIRAPLFFAGLIIALVFAVLGIIAAATHCWPLL